jgi:hypothetical protein
MITGSMVRNFIFGNLLLTFDCDSDLRHSVFKGKVAWDFFFLKRRIGQDKLSYSPIHRST